MFVFLGLAVCVFTWGLQYKLSLYDPPHSISHRVAQAKLSTNDEHSRTEGIVRAIGSEPIFKIVRRSPVTPSFIVNCVPAVNLAVLVPKEQFSDSSRHLHPAFTAVFFIRPPPVQS